MSDIPMQFRALMQDSKAARDIEIAHLRTALAEADTLWKKINTSQADRLSLQEAEIARLRREKAELVGALRPFAEITTLAQSLSGPGPSYIVHDNGSLHKACEAARAALRSATETKDKPT